MKLWAGIWAVLALLPLSLVAIEPRVWGAWLVLGLYLWALLGSYRMVRR